MTVSVAMAVYCGQTYLNAQIASVLPQLEVCDELVISAEENDHSCDAIFQAYEKDSRVKIVRQPKHGVVPNFENALRHCKGDWIFLCDQDDLWLETKVLKVKKLLQEKPNTLLILHDATVVDAEEHVLQPSFFQWHGVRHGVLRNWWRNSYMGCCMAFHRSLLTVALPFPKKLPMHDQWLGMLSERIGKTEFLEEPLILWRRHGKNASQTKHASIGKMISFRWHLLFAYLFRKKK